MWYSFAYCDLPVAVAPPLVCPWASGMGIGWWASTPPPVFLPFVTVCIVPVSFLLPSSAHNIPIKKNLGGAPGKPPHHVSCRWKDIGTEKVRIGTDFLTPFDCCCLCLQVAPRPLRDVLSWRLRPPPTP